MSNNTAVSQDISLPPYSHELEWPDGLSPYQVIDKHGTQGDPYSHFRWMREHYPVLRGKTLQEDVWIISRHADVRKAMRSPKIFKSDVNEGVPLTFLTLLDGSTHARLRHTIAGAFTPASVALLEDRICAIVNDYIDRVINQDAAKDIVAEFAKPITMGTISGLLDVPLDDLAQITQGAEQLFAYMGRVTRSMPGNANDEEQALEFLDYLEENLRRLHKNGSSSVGGHIASQWLDEGSIDEREARELAGFLFVAGFDTTSRLLAATFRQFKEAPELMDALNDNPEKIDNFIEELVRFRGPVVRAVRRTTQDVEIAGVTIPEGAMVRLLIGSANRDESVWGPEADEFKIDRENTDHFGFGYGIHSCIGAPLARMEMRIFIQELVSKVSRIDFDDELDLQLLKGNAMPIGVDSLRVQIGLR